MFLYLIDFLADLLVDTLKDIVPGDCKFFVKMCNTCIYIKKANQSASLYIMETFLIV